MTGDVGSAGFHPAARLLDRGRAGAYLDDHDSYPNDYYNVVLEWARLGALLKHADFRFAWLDLERAEGVAAPVDRHRPAVIAHLVVATWADADALKRDVGFEPCTPIEEGLRRVVRWHRVFYGV